MAKAKSKLKSKVCFEGVMAALPTPLEDNGEIKVKTVKKLIDHLLDEGLYGFYVTGATGEGACLSAKKREVMVGRYELLMAYIKQYCPRLAAKLARKLKPM